MNSNTDVNKTILLTLGDNHDIVKVCAIHLITLGLGSYHRCWCSGYTSGLVIQNLVDPTHSRQITVK